MVGIARSLTLLKYLNLQIQMDSQRHKTKAN